MSDLNKLAERMRAEWDERIAHDYRFWMSDGQSSDQQMWQTGDRDFAILLRDFPEDQRGTLLEVGCGVGRLLRPAAKHFKKVIGIDVSQVAIEKARELLKDASHVEPICGDGLTLRPVPDGSVDAVISFAALTSMPTRVIANYLLEMKRVLKPTGEIRLQVYLGKEQQVREEDTLFLRCYGENNFQNAIQAAGFTMLWQEELVLPFTVSVKESGIVASIVALKPCAAESASADEVARCLLPGGEAKTTIDAGCRSDLEYWMTMQYAKKHMRESRDAEAKRALAHVLSTLRDTQSSVEDLYQQLRKEIQEESASQSTVTQQSPQDHWTRNLAILRERMPAIARIVEQSAGRGEVLVVQQSEQGPILFEGKQCLDHPSKPNEGAAAWADRVLREARIKNCSELVVYGLGAGYHIEYLLNTLKIPISCIEPNPSVLRVAMEERDLSDLLTRVHHIGLGEEIDSTIFKDTPEMAIRPQTQTLHAQHCNRMKALSYETRGFTSLHPTVAVLGPLQGGTLPIAAYTLRSLSSLKQRHRDFDMSGFNQGFGLMDNMLFEEPRKEVMRGNYLELLSQLVLEATWEKPIDILICMAQAPISGRALQELRKRGIITVLWFVEDYLRFTYWKNMASYYDYVFTIQKGACIDQIKQAGAGEVHYLPTACDPGVHAPLTLSAEERNRWGSPISFVGAGYYNRQQVFAGFAEMPFKLWGTEWPECRPFDRMVQEKGRRLTPGEYVKIFNATDININLHSSTERDDADPSGDFINPRTFELAACNAFQLVDERSHLPELMTPGKEIVTFRNRHELKELIGYYQDRPEERKKIAAAGRERVLRDHTYDQRIKKMLSIIYGGKYEHLFRREQESPWGKMLKRSKVDAELEQRCQSAFERGDAAKLDPLVADIHTGKGKLSETEQKLLFLFHVRKQIINMAREETIERK
jgi:spore maturation protein CgeB